MGVSAEDFERGSRRHWALEPFTGDALHTADDPRWPTLRAMFKPFFATSMMERHFCAFLNALPRDPQVFVDLQEILPGLTTDITTDMLFGSSIQTLKQSSSNENQQFAQACEYASKVTWRRFALGWVYAVLPDQRYQRSLHTVHAVTDKHISETLQRKKTNLTQAGMTSEDRAVFSDHLAVHTRNPKLLRDLLLGTLLGGRETTAFLLSNVFHVLSRKPVIWQRLRAGALGLGSASFTFSSLRRAFYAQFCVQECRCRSS